MVVKQKFVISCYEEFLRSIAEVPLVKKCFLLFFIGDERKKPIILQAKHKIITFLRDFEVS